MPETISDTRAHLTGLVARFRAEGADAEPVVFGDRRRAEAVLLPHETYELLVGLAEDYVVGERVRQRLAADPGRRTSLAVVAAELGVDLDQL